MRHGIEIVNVADKRSRSKCNDYDEPIRKFHRDTLHCKLNGYRRDEVLHRVNKEGYARGTLSFRPH